MSIVGFEDKVRDFINSGRTQRALLKDAASWNKICSSLDLIGDTQLAIEAYPEFEGLADGASYLVVYGILQTLLLQQDAAKNIGDSLDIKVNLPKALNDIRVIRNNAAGHPGHQKENGQSKSCFITRMSITPFSFQLMTVYSGERKDEFRTISIPPLLKVQEKYLNEILEKVVYEMEKREMEHRNMYKDNKLVDIFPKSSRYLLGKIAQAAGCKFDHEKGIMNLDTLSESLYKFKSELISRGEWDGNDSVGYHYDLIEYPISRLKSYFYGKDDINEKDAYIFSCFISEQFKTLKELAVEIDEAYASELK